MLLNLNKKAWTDSLRLTNFSSHCKANKKSAEQLLSLSKAYAKVLDDLLCKIHSPLNNIFWLKSLDDEVKMTKTQLALKNVGKRDPKRHLEEEVEQLMERNIVQSLGTQINTTAFK